MKKRVRFVGGHLLAASALLALVLALALGGCQQDPPPTPDDTTWSASDSLEYAPGRSGEVRTITVTGPDGEPMSITYEIIDGLAIAGGDMIMGLASDFEGLDESYEIVIDPESIRMQPHCLWFLVDIWCKGRLWPNATVPYTFRDDWGSNNAVMRARIEEAMSRIEAVTAVRFVPRTNQDDYVRFQNSDGCSSWIGRDGGRQDINLSVRCGTGAVVHEILHALALLHEHQRSDRNSFVQILWDNIQNSKKHNFEREDRSVDIGSYDYDSIMHYSTHAFCKKNDAGSCVGPTIVTVPSGTTVGRDVMSPGDIAAINLLYPGLPPTISVISPTPGSSFSRRVTNVYFQANVTDPEDMDVEVRWTSNVSGLLGTGNPLTINTGDMAYGAHVVTARAEDPQGNVATATVNLTVTNDPPTVDLYHPLAGGFCVDEMIQFRATVIDLNELGATLPDNRVEWRVGTAAPFATGKAVTRSFGSAGGVQVVVKATDELGLYAEDWVGLNIAVCADLPPTVTITQPPGDVTYEFDGYDSVRGQWYKDVTLQGNAVDPEDGALTGGALVWTTDRSDMQNSYLGVGTSLTVRLYADDFSGAQHTVTLTATDSGGNVRTAVVRIYIYTLG